MVIKIHSKKHGTQDLIIDDRDYSFIKLYNWSLLKAKYGFHAFVNLRVNRNKYKSVLIHRLIMGVDDERTVDHIDGNGLNNKRNNLRVCTMAENNKNLRISKRNKSGYKGVFYLERWGKYLAYIHANGKRIHLGGFDLIEDAVKAYNEAAKKYHGQFAKLNLI